MQKERVSNMASIPRAHERIYPMFSQSVQGFTGDFFFSSNKLYVTVLCGIFSELIVVCFSLVLDKLFEKGRVNNFVISFFVETSTPEFPVGLFWFCEKFFFEGLMDFRTSVGEFLRGELPVALLLFLRSRGLTVGGEFFRERGECKNGERGEISEFRCHFGDNKSEFIGELSVIFGGVSVIFGGVSVFFGVSVIFGGETEE